MARAGGGRKTAEALGEIFAVTAVTIRRDGAFAAAVNTLVAHGGADIKPLILSRGARLTRGQVLGLAEQPPEAQLKRLLALFVARLSESGRREPESESQATSAARFTSFPAP